MKLRIVYTYITSIIFRTEKRDELKQYLLDNNIFTEIHYPVSPNHQEGYQTYFSGLHFPVSEEIHRTTLSLPIFMQQL